MTILDFVNRIKTNRIEAYFRKVSSALFFYFVNIFFIIFLGGYFYFSAILIVLGFVEPRMPVRTESTFDLFNSIQTDRFLSSVIQGGQFYGTFPGTFCQCSFESWFALDRMFDQGD